MEEIFELLQYAHLNYSFKKDKVWNEKDSKFYTVYHIFDIIHYISVKISEENDFIPSFTLLLSDAPVDEDAWEKMKSFCDLFVSKNFDF